jgi:light-regulated signal transduction histidine kinase (bacteriophytochrome)
MNVTGHASHSHLDITTCDREPIHIPGAIQPHGFLLALDATQWNVRFASENVGNYLRVQASAALGRPVEELFAPSTVAALREAATHPLFAQRALFVTNVRADADKISAPFSLLAHRFGGCVIVEGEATEGEFRLDPRPGVHHEMDILIAGMEDASDMRSLLQIAAVETRRITGFDRVMIYQFDSEWNGNVVAEDRNDRMPSYLHLRFPASDIPRQARELYRINRLRLIARNDYTPVRLLAQTKDCEPLDLSLSTLRSVSPVHLEYMRNMGMSSSMSISLMRGDELWGLISCHGRDPKIVPFDVRATCELFGQVLSLQIATREQAAKLAYRNQLNSVLTRLMASMSRQQDIFSSLRGQSADWLAVANATGAAVLFNDRLEVTGRTPTKTQIVALSEWLHQHAKGDVTAFEKLAEKNPAAAEYADVASGLLAIPLSRLHRNYVLWFRPEVISTVKWGGNPTKPVEQPTNEPTRLHPRKSFEAWAEIVRGRSTPWQAVELDVARELRSGIIEIVLQHAEQLAAVSEELVKANKELETISYTISHDLRAPLRAMYGYADSLREETAEKLNADELDRLDRISRAAHRLDEMIRDVLRYGHVSRIQVNVQPVSLERILREILKQHPALKAEHSNIQIKGELPSVMADTELLEPALTAIVCNAVKFVPQGVSPVVAIKAEKRDSHVRLWVQDNGIGIAPEDQQRIFEVFQNVHPQSRFEGNGIGLAIAKRAVIRLGGDIGVESAIGRGSRFWIELPSA